ncbi:protein kinase, putative, partial [Entamoeba invadens IP1]
EESVVKVYTSEIILALEYIHSLGCIHRDLKPDNVLVDKDGHLLLTDFGLSVVGICSESNGIKESRLLCTPDYVAPESLKEFFYCKQSDYFSLGCMVFEMIVGVPPFSCHDPQGIFDRILKGIYVWYDDVEVSDECKGFVDRLLENDYNKRLGKGGLDEIKKEVWMKGIAFDSLLSESREDIFVPELDDECDTGYFDVDVDRNNSLTKITKTEKGDEEFVSFDFVNTNPVIDKNMDIVERKSSAVNICEDDDDDTEELEPQSPPPKLTKAASMFN